MNLQTQLIDFEGWKQDAYPDPLTLGDPWTIGVGHTGPEVYRGLKWTDEQITVALAKDIAEKTAQVKKHIPWFDRLNEPRQAVLVGMAFQLGINGMLGFNRTLGAVRDERWADAANGMRASKWHKQTPRRVDRLAAQMETGEWN
jgi:lysozyme